MDIKDRKHYVNNMFDKVFYNDKAKQKKVSDLNTEESYFEDHEIIDEYRDNKRSYEEY